MKRTDLELKIEKRITEYLDFDVNNLLENTYDNNDAYIFGGAVRDSIAGKKINDVDILCLPNTFKNFVKILKGEGYVRNTKMVVKDIENLYKNIHVIFEPVSYIKIIENEIRIVQLIKPAIHSRDIFKIKQSMFSLLGQVDFSNCGIAYDKNGLKEVVNGSILQCEMNIFTYLGEKQLMQSDRTIDRKFKFEERGWKYCKDLNQNQDYVLKYKIYDLNKKYVRYKKRIDIDYYMFRYAYEKQQSFEKYYLYDL